MRRNFVFYALIPAIIIGIVVYLFIDRWIEAGMEKAGESIVGATVEIDHLHLSLFPLGIQFERLQVANPRDTWRNVFQTGEVRFSMNTGQLLRGKYVIEMMEVHDLILGTRRATDGALPGGTAEGGSSAFAPLAQYIESSVASSPVFDLSKLRAMVNIDSVVAGESRKINQQLDSLRGVVTASSALWSSTLADIDSSKAELTRTVSTVKGIDVNALNTPQGVTTALTTVQNAYSSVNNIKQSLTQHVDSVSRGVSRLTSTVAGVPGLVQQDLALAMNGIHLPDLSTKGLAELIVGRQLYGEAAKALYWVDWAKSKVPSPGPKQEKEETPRMKGQDIRFPVEHSYPKFWIRNVAISGGTDRATMDTASVVYLTGEAHDISSDQRVTGKPLVVALSGTRGGTLQIAFNASFDRRNDESHDVYHLTAKGISPGSFVLGKKGFLPSHVEGIGLDAGISIDLPGNSYDARATMNITNMQVVFDSTASSTVERLVQEVLASVHGFTAVLRMWNLEDGPRVALSTDLDAILAARVSSVVGAEIQKLKQDLQAKLEAAIARKRQELEQLVAVKRKDAEDRMQAATASLGEGTGILDGKKQELNARLEKLKAGAVQNAVKGIFGK